MSNYIIEQKKGRTILRSLKIDDSGLDKVLVNVYPNNITKVLLLKHSANEGETVKFKYRGFNWTLNKIHDEVN